MPGNLGDKLAAANPADEEAARLRGRLHVLQGEKFRLVGALGKMTVERDNLVEELASFSEISLRDQKVPLWITPKKLTRAHQAQALLMLSDLHLDEVVDLEEMNGINHFNREIAHRRLDNVINGTVDLLTKYTAGVKIIGITVALNGDIITGSIHDELDRTNEAPVSESIVHWVPYLVSAIRHLADEFGRVFVPCTDGNHDRFYKQTPYKQRAQSSLAWIIYNTMAHAFRNDPRVTFSITKSPDQLYDIYGTTFLQTHGDQFRSAGGIGGLYPSMLKYVLRMHDLYSKQIRDFDYILLGHHHQNLWGQDFVVNAALKGYDEYAKGHGFKFVLPSQQLFTITPERGMGTQWTVHAD